MNRTDKLWLAGPYIPIGAGLLLFKNAWIAVLGFHGVILAALWIHRNKWNIATLWNGGGLAWLPVIMVLTLAFGIGLIWIAELFPGYDRYLRRVLRGLGVSGPWMAVLAIYTCMVNPVLEEAFWRGLFFEGHRRPAISDLAYGGIHVLVFLPFMSFHQALVGAVFLVGIGYLWRTIARRRGGLALPLAWHALGDVVVILVVAWIIRVV